MEVHGRIMEEHDSDNDADDNKQENTDGNLVGIDTADSRTEAVLAGECENHIERSCLFTKQDNNVGEHLSGEDVDCIAPNANENLVGEKQDTSKGEKQDTSIFCDPCENDGEHLPAAGYCVDCDEFLCEICFKGHCRPSVTRHHVLLEADKMPSAKKCDNGNNTDTCKEHFGQDIEYYCKTHEELGCSSCMKIKHEKCGNTERLATVLNKYSDSSEVFSAIESLKSTTFHAKRMKTQIRTNRHAVTMYQDKALSDISECRSKINELFDKLENDVRFTIDDKVHKDTTNLTALERKVDTMVFDLQTLDAHIKHLKTKPNDVYQLFVSVKNTKKKMLECTEELKRIETQNQVNRYQLNVSDSIKKLGEYKFCLGELKAIQSENKIISECEQLINVTSDSDTKSQIAGMVLLPSNLLVCIDEANRALKLINMPENIIMARKCFDSAPCDVTKVNDRTVAVLLADKSKVLVVSISKDEELVTEKEIDIEGKCHSIFYIEEEGRLAVLLDNELHFIDFGGEIHTKLKLDMPPHKEFGRSSKLILSEDRRAVVILKLDNIYLFDRKGRKLRHIYYSYMHPYIFSDIRRLGISMDAFGTLYTCENVKYGDRLYMIVARNIFSSYDLAYCQELTRINEAATSIVYCNTSCRLFVATDAGVRIFRVA